MVDVDEFQDYDGSRYLDRNFVDGDGNNCLMIAAKESNFEILINT